MKVDARRVHGCNMQCVAELQLIGRVGHLSDSKGGIMGQREHVRGTGIRSVEYVHLKSEAINEIHLIRRLDLDDLLWSKELVVGAFNVIPEGLTGIIRSGI